MIPVNPITGFLSIGKTTTVIDLLKRKPGNAHWDVSVPDIPREKANE